MFDFVLFPKIETLHELTIWVSWVWGLGTLFCFVLLVIFCARYLLKVHWLLCDGMGVDNFVARTHSLCF